MEEIVEAWSWLVNSQREGLWIRSSWRPHCLDAAARKSPVLEKGYRMSGPNPFISLCKWPIKTLDEALSKFFSWAYDPGLEIC